MRPIFDCADVALDSTVSISIHTMLPDLIKAIAMAGEAAAGIDEGAIFQQRQVRVAGVAVVLELAESRVDSNLIMSGMSLQCI
jgi:hypothetical protein